MNFFIGWEYPEQLTHHGIIYLNQFEFANIYFDLHNTKKWICNRSSLALKMQLPVQGLFDSPEQMLKELQQWYERIN